MCQTPKSINQIIYYGTAYFFFRNRQNTTRKETLSWKTCPPSPTRTFFDRKGSIRAISIGTFFKGCKHCFGKIGFFVAPLNVLFFLHKMHTLITCLNVKSILGQKIWWRWSILKIIKFIKKNVIKIYVTCVFNHENYALDSLLENSTDFVKNSYFQRVIHPCNILARNIKLNSKFKHL